MLIKPVLTSQLVLTPGEAGLVHRYDHPGNAGGPGAVDGVDHPVVPTRGWFVGPRAVRESEGRRDHHEAHQWGGLRDIDVGLPAVRSDQSGQLVGQAG